MTTNQRRPRRPGGRRFFVRRKVCAFCVAKIEHIDYKDVGRIRRFLSERARIDPRRKTGTCAKHQRALSEAIKRARHLALLPFTPEHARLMSTYHASTAPRFARTEQARDEGVAVASTVTENQVAETTVQGSSEGTSGIEATSAPEGPAQVTADTLTSEEEASIPSKEMVQEISGGDVGAAEDQEVSVAAPSSEVSESEEERPE
jgi:small subunit ribosomal protein S18